MVGKDLSLKRRVIIVDTPHPHLWYTGRNRPPPALLIGPRGPVLLVPGRTALPALTAVQHEAVVVAGQGHGTSPGAGRRCEVWEREKRKHRGFDTKVPISALTAPKCDSWTCVWVLLMLNCLRVSPSLLKFPTQFPKYPSSRSVPTLVLQFPLF